MTITNNKKSTRTQAILTLVVLLALNYGVTMISARFGYPLTRVFITNNLDALGGPKLDLKLHCKSKQDDLGVHVVAPTQNWQFQFHPNFVIGTLFFCRFEWQGIDYKYFDIYDQSRDIARCPRECCWSIKPTGPCFCPCTGPCDFNKNCYPWNS